jgi:diacylglycerol kinase
MKRSGRGSGGKLRNVGRGLFYAVRNDRSVTLLLPVSVVGLAASAILARWVDVVVLVVVTGQALTAELMNTALEKLCDVVQSGHDERIGRIKDVAAAAAGISLAAWVVVLLYEYLRLGLLLFGPRP